MKKLIAFAALFILSVIPIPTKAQRVIVGVDGGSSFGNLFLGPETGLEIPFAKRYEVDLYDAFSPIEEHIKLGSGWANNAKAGGIIWLNKNIGINGYAEYANYSTSIYKANKYAFGGVDYETAGLLLNFDYIREFNNGISNGIETSHVQGGDFGLKIRTYCSKHLACYRFDFDFEVGRVLEQGNPVCDGTYGPVTCPRTVATAGGFTGAFVIELSRHNNKPSRLF